MKFVNGLATVLALTTLAACSGGGGGNGGGNSQTPANSYAGFEFSTTQEPLVISGSASSYNTNRILLSDKAPMDITDAATYHMNLMVGNSECITAASAGSMFNKTYSMVMVRKSVTTTNDPTWAVVTTGVVNQSGHDTDTVTFSALKATSTIGSFVVTTDKTNTGTNGGSILKALRLDLPAIGENPTFSYWSCSSNGVATYTGADGVETWKFIGNDSVLIVKTPNGSVYLGFSNDVTLSSATSLVGQSMEQYSFLYGSADDYNNCPLTCSGRPSSSLSGTQSGVLYSGSPVRVTMPQAGDQTPLVNSVSLSTASTALSNSAYAPTQATTAKFNQLIGTGNMMGNSIGHDGAILGVVVKVGTQYMTVFTHQFNSTRHSNDIFTEVGGIMISITP